MQWATWRKDKQQDVQEAISSLLRYLEMQTEDERNELSRITSANAP